MAFIAQMTMVLNQSNSSVEETRKAINERLELLERRMMEEKERILIRQTHGKQTFSNVSRHK